MGSPQFLRTASQGSLRSLNLIREDHILVLPPPPPWGDRKIRSLDRLLVARDRPVVGITISSELLRERGNVTDMRLRGMAGT